MAVKRAARMTGTEAENRGLRLLAFWGHFVLLASICLIFAQLVSVLGSIDALLLVRNGLGLVVDIAIRVLVMLAAGVAAGTAAVLAVTLVLGLFRSATPQRRIDMAERLATNATILFCCALGVRMTVHWIVTVSGLAVTQETQIRSSLLVFAVCVLLMAAARFRRHPPRYLVPTPGRAATRRAVIATGVGAAVIAATGLAAGPRPSRAVPQRPAGRSAGPNVVLVTFDALSAEDMSLYGYHLPTTPNIDAFAQRASVFTNFYSTSTFTTPCVASLYTGRYPTSTKVYEIDGRLEGDATAKTLPGALRRAGFETAASVANPWAHPARLGCGGDFDLLPLPPMPLFEIPGLLMGLGASDVFDDAWTVSRIPPRLIHPMTSVFGPKRSFTQAEMLLAGLKSPYFLHVHVFAPHSPYQPSAPFLHRFLSTDEFRSAPDYWNVVTLPDQGYTPDRQPLVDRARLRYAEWIAEADAAFGEFLERGERAGKFDNAVVIVSADHGESFQGGVFSHGGPRQVRPMIHIPMVVRLPGQSRARRVEIAADLTSVAATTLDLVGLPRPDWMEGRSLRPWLDGVADDKGEGFAFTQFLARDAVGGPLAQGTVGVIDGRHQYVIDLERGSGVLNLLDDAHLQTEDLAGGDPALAARLRREIATRFPMFGPRAS
jgi:arylsulfatase A-like enzyme